MGIPLFFVMLKTAELLKNPFFFSFSIMISQLICETVQQKNSTERDEAETLTLSLT